MVAGDVVNAIGGDNAILDFQPAVGVEVVITWLTSINGTTNARLFDGVNQSINFHFTAASRDLLASVKLFINNTNYLRLSISGVGERNGFTGIETQ